MIGDPTPKEILCLDNAQLWESLIPFALLMEKPDTKPKAEYDWRVVIANQRQK